MKKTIEIFKDYIKTKGLKNTSPRINVLKAFIAAGKHLTADELYLIIRQDNPDIGRTTVYRTLKLICEANIAREVFLNDRIAKYEMNLGQEHHDHLVCLNCGAIHEVLDPKIEQLQDKLSEKYKFKALRHRLEIFGLCEKCVEKEGKIYEN